MEQILTKLLTAPIEIILSLTILGIVFIGILYLRTLRKAAKNDYHELPELTKAILRELTGMRTESGNAHTKQIEVLGRIDGRLSK
mgnify:CR=1 FL=1